jgi:hypothetical protein
VLRLLPAMASCMNFVQKNQFRELNQHILTFLLSTVGDALMASKLRRSLIGLQIQQ